MSDDVYTGTRYLIDLEGSCQYALDFRHGKPVSTLRIFKMNDDGAEQKPPFSIIALDDDIVKKRGHVGIEFSTVVYCIDINDKGSISRIYQHPITYHTNGYVDPRSKAVRLYLTAAMQDALAVSLRRPINAELFVAPKVASRQGSYHIPFYADASTPAGIYLDQDMLMKMHMRPEHGDRAFMARRETAPLKPSFDLPPIERLWVENAAFCARHPDVTIAMAQSATARDCRDIQINSADDFTIGG